MHEEDQSRFEWLGGIVVPAVDVYGTTSQNALSALPAGDADAAVQWRKAECLRSANCKEPRNARCSAWQSTNSWLYLPNGWVVLLHLWQLLLMFE